MDRWPHNLPFWWVLITNSLGKTHILSLYWRYPFVTFQTMEKLP